ncbi:MAG: LTA synthase family protein [Neisseria sp.]|nr:LTA synthase family protein [Neisseria sp.]
MAAHKKWLVLAAVVTIVLLAAGIRGSIGKFPLRQDSAQISTSVHINRLVPNALIALDWARKEHKNSNQFHPVSDSDGITLISRLSGEKADSADLQQFIVKATVNPSVEKRRPNVVLAVMESMGSHLLDFNNGERDLLGGLQTHFDNDWLYRKFVSEGDGTSDSLHRLFVRSPIVNLSQSSAKNKTFPSNMFQPYLDAGYEVVYITAGNGGWRDFDSFLRHLGVNEFVDENALKRHYPEAVSETWGVPDEFMFRYAAEKLAAAEKSGKPVFIMLLSITNHPPYKLPAPHREQQFALSGDEAARLANLARGEELNRILNTFRYSNDQLGRFIGAVKQNAPDTIIAATGDHNMRAIGYPQPEEAALGHAVPFYLYVPERYRENHVYQPQRAGSHKDIMPTLYALSLSNRPYYQNGCDLTAPEQMGMWCGYGYNTEVVVTEKGFYHAGSKQYYRWSDEMKLSTEQAAPDKLEQMLIERTSVYGSFLDWQINKMASGSKE